MCLVSYIPLKDGYILSSNRDENPERAAAKVVKQTVGDEQIEFPQDVKGGSWIIKSSKNRLVCILNGAFKNHVQQLPYRLSRGVMMKQFFEFNQAVDFFEHYNFWNIEPFTMIIVDQGLFEFRWDGSRKYIKTLDRTQIHIWSSCTLYDQQSQNKREHVLRRSLMNINVDDSEALIKAHTLYIPQDQPNGLFIDRDIVKTISHTQVKLSDSAISMKHFDLSKR